MEQKNYITSLCSIKNGIVSLDGVSGFSDKALDSVDFIKAAYKEYQLSYPKFYKMDNLCKLAFVASELLLKHNPLAQKYASEDIAIIIANSASSLEIDTEHHRTISDKNNYFPSPSVFVYTLPNILVGEIAIRNSIKGENSFFIFDKFDADFMSSYINSLMNSNKAKCCITGWIEFYENKYEAFLYSVEKEQGISTPLDVTNNKQMIFKIEHTAQELKKLYNH